MHSGEELKELHGQIVNISVSMAKVVSWKGESVSTGISKSR